MHERGEDDGRKDADKKCRHVADSARCLYVTFLFSASALGFVCAVVLFAPPLGLPAHSAAARALLPVILLPGVLISLRPLPERLPLLGRADRVRLAHTDA